MSSVTSDLRSDFLLRTDLEEVAPFVSDLIHWEEERQARKLILIPSESSAPRAVRQALGSVFQNVYAEGYPPLRMTRAPEERLHDVAWQLAFYRRYADRRFYKGVDYVHFVECLAQRRCAEAFAHGSIRPEHIHVNVQPLSGAAANLAVYWALMEPGDTLMGLDLFQGGHLTHGSEFNISGQRYRVVSYGVNPQTEKLDYDQIRDMALEHQPKVIVAGYTSYPWAPDWAKFRAIADEAGAYLMADISHTAGMASAGVYPNPLGLAHVTTFTTHKTICGPRGAVILTTDEELAKEIDMAIFPGEQGGPHVNKFAALAVAFRIAQTDEFGQLQRQIVINARALAEGLQKRGLRLAYGGTDTHLLLIDLKSVGDRKVWGEPAVRILDLAGIVANKNTIPGDTETSLAMGVRLGVPWITQRGLDEADVDVLAGLIHRVVSNIRPFAYNGLIGTLPRGKIELDILEEVRRGVAKLAEKAGIDFEYERSGYPHYPETRRVSEILGVSLRVTGWRARQFVQQVVTANVAELAPGDSLVAYMLDRRGKLMDKVAVAREEQDEWGRDAYLITPTPANAARVTAWLRGLADGYVLFDDEDVFRKVEGPVVVEEVEAGERGSGEAAGQGRAASELFGEQPERFDLTKVYFVGQSYLNEFAPQAEKEEWRWEEPEKKLKRTPLYEVHKKLGAKLVPFAGWEMPVWYTSVSDEHRAVREAAGLFDVAHMGAFEVKGPHATAFLDTVLSNYAAWIEDGQSLYGYLLDPDANVIDDVMIYRRRADLYLMVVNAANEEKDWDWLNAVNERRVVIDRQRPWVEVEAQATLRNLKDPAAGERQKRDIALQGPASLPTLQALTGDPELRAALARVRRTDLIECELAGISLVIARTGYTGEDLGYEIMVHPDDAVRLWEAILEAGEPFGVKPAGLACRDSTRTEAGLPLYGHELAGPFDISPIEAGFPGYVKYHKPFFVGRDVLLAREAGRKREVIRFRVNQKGERMPHTGDPVVNKKGKQIGQVTSCSIDSAGYLLGLAIVEKRYNEPDTPIAIFTLHGKSLEEGLLRGNKVALPVEATVLTRFPEREGARMQMGGQD
ncbi:MAG: glycine cleavage system aminomethyltransferase GcvT [Chloroflexi bacterium]|nr:MAG: glycine cleavage system protein T [Anaerolineaceae bacterium 4572_32.2]RLC81874.1 MAG: glycine cleavage system aminomethyltransferase GcvT [Chloroflexota bacterium]RLC86479.1 MAG: glycine cleavage system aminomethyltransferase GcvT [Chloroflexota bacterium]HEY73914.1 glycine cleavage system aminomethyltransferase GcvT [Thermoflexia bacterium]